MYFSRKQMINDIKQMTWAERYAHVLDAYATAMNCENGSSGYNHAVFVIKIHWELLDEHRKKSATRYIK